jgi:hypothetical protein
MIDLNQPSAVILIDLWDNYHRPYSALITNIISFLDKTDSIESIILATYDAREEISENNIWNYNNYSMCINRNSESESILKLYREYYNIDINDPNEIQKTVKNILEYPNKFRIRMRRLWELNYFLSINPNIKNIYILGSAWDICVKIRPLGYLELSKIPNINILTKQYCVETSRGCLPDISNEIDWYHVTDDIYCYKPQP